MHGTFANDGLKVSKELRKLSKYLKGTKILQSISSMLLSEYYFYVLITI